MTAHTSAERRNSRVSLTDDELLQLCRESIADGAGTCLAARMHQAGEIDAATLARHIAAEKARIAQTSGWRNPFASSLRQG